MRRLIVPVVMVAACCSGQAPSASEPNPVPLPRTQQPGSPSPVTPTPQPPPNASATGGVPPSQPVAVPLQPSPAGTRVVIDLDRSGGHYRVGDTAIFRISVKDGGGALLQGKVSYILNSDAVQRIGQGDIQLGSEPATLRQSLDAPGFLLLTVVFQATNTRAISTQVGAAFEPQAILPGLPAPADFKSFWIEQKRRLDRVPPETVMTRVPSDARYEAFDVRAQCPGGAPMSGYLARPVHAAPHSLPAVLWLHGAGVGSSVLANVLESARLGYLAMDINAHGIKNGESDAFYAGLATGALKDYVSIGIRSRETSYFLGMYLRALRAVQVLAAQPEWDGHVLIARGPSQGGGQALAVAALDPRVSAVIAAEPAMTDLAGYLAHRRMGWPQIVVLSPSGDPDRATIEVLRYFDGVNFAPEIHAEAIFGVGYLDTTVPPSAVYAAYNAYVGHKEIVEMQAVGHGTSSAAEAAYTAFAAAQVRAHHPP